MKKILLSILGIFSITFVTGDTLTVKSLGDTDGNGVNDFSMNRVSSDGTVTMLLEFESEYGSCAGCSFVNEYEGKFYLGGGNGFAIYDVKTNTVSYEAATENALITRQMVWDGESIISEEENGEIHIGENSLVTIEQDGKQQLYATDANGDQIDINIKKGSDLLVDGKSVSQAITDVATNKTNIATNTTNIATNKTNIATNTQAITSLGTRVDGLTNLVNTFDQRITDLQTLTGTMMSEYRSGIASSVALSQIRYASKGFSIGVGQGEFKDKDEMAVGIGYGGEFNDRVGYQFQFGSSGDTSGFGFTITF